MDCRVGFFITMNPSYAAVCTELPESVKAVPSSGRHCARFTTEAARNTTYSRLASK